MHAAGGTSTVQSLGRGRAAREFVFVPNSADGAAAAGVVMGYVFDGNTNRSDLVMLDGQTLDTVATIHLLTRIPFGFHGNWLPA